MFIAPGSILLLLVLAIGVMAQDKQPAAKEKTNAPSTGTISGRVVNESGEPMPDAMVYVRTSGLNVNQYMSSADREGAFQVSGLDQAAYTVSATAPAYVTPPRDPSTPAPTYRPGDAVTITLIKGAVVTGTVVNANGEPVVGIAVRVQIIRDSHGRSLPRGLVREDMTDDRGIYRVYGLLPGTYVAFAGGPTESSYSVNQFETDVPTYSPSATRETAGEISVHAGEEVSGIDIRYRAEQGRSVAGEVKGVDARAGITVTLVAAGEGAAGWHTNYFQGSGNSSFVFNGIADGDYDVYAQFFAPTGERGITEQKRVSVRGADVTGVVLGARLFGSIAGRLVVEDATVAECTDKERPLFNDTMVSAWHNENEAAKRTPQLVWGMGAPAAPNTEGNFVLQNLAAGEYFFAARSQAKYWYLRSVSLAPPASAGAKARPVDATRTWTNLKPGEKLTGLTLTLAHGATALRGKLVLAEGEQAPQRTIAYLIPAERERAEEVLRYFSTQVSSDLKFAFNNVPPGRYWLMAQPLAEGESLARTRFPHATALRARLRRDAETVKSEVELKPCQSVTDLQISLKPPVQ